MRKETAFIVIIAAIAVALVGAIVYAGVIMPAADNATKGGDNSDHDNSSPDGKNSTTPGGGSDNQSSIIKPPIVQPINQSGGPGSNTPKTEPTIALSWSSPLPGTEGAAPEYWQHFSFHQPYTLYLNNSVRSDGNDTLVADVIFFPRLNSTQVEVHTFTASDERMKVNLWSDGAGGCYGLLLDDRSNIQIEKAWTWSYGNGTTDRSVKFDITLNVLGPQSFAIRAYDQDTGQDISLGGIEASVRVYGQYMMDTGTKITFLDEPIATNPEATGVVQNLLIHDELDPDYVGIYQGTVKDNLRFDGQITVTKVWAYIGGEWKEWTPDPDGSYSFYWDAVNQIYAHELFVQVQYAPPLPTTWGEAVMHHGVYDAGSGESMMPLFGEAHTDYWYYLQWSTPEG